MRKEEKKSCFDWQAGWQANRNSYDRLIYDIIPPRKVIRISKEILGIKQYKTRRQKVVALGWRLALTAVFVFFLATGVSPLAFFRSSLNAFFGGRTAVIDLYSGQCAPDEISEDFHLGWWQAGKAVGKPDLGPEAEFNSFSDVNSAFYQGGQYSLVCGKFASLPDDEATSTPSSSDSNGAGAARTADSLGNSNQNDNQPKVDLPAVENQKASITGLDIQINTDLSTTTKVEIDDTKATSQVQIIEEDRGSSTGVQAPISKVEKFILASWGKAVNYFHRLSQTALAEEKNSNKTLEDLGVFQSAKIKLSLAMVKKIEQNPAIQNQPDKQIETPALNMEATSSAEQNFSTNSPSVGQEAGNGGQNLDIASSSEAQNDNAVNQNSAATSGEQAFIEPEKVEIIEPESDKSKAEIVSPDSMPTNKSPEVQIENPTGDSQPVSRLDEIKNKLFKIFNARADESGINEPAGLTIWYTFDDVNLGAQSTSSSLAKSSAPSATSSGPVWHEVGELGAAETSNFLHGNYLSFDAPFVTSWEQARNIKIKIEGKEDKAAGFVVYLDSVFVEAVYEAKPSESELLKKARWEKMLELLSNQTVFKINEKGELKFHYQKNREGFLDYLGFGDYWKNVDIKISIKDAQGTVVRIPTSMIFEGDGDFTINLPGAGRQFRPGQYEIVFNIEDSSGDATENIVLERGFEWGVLAVNFNKSVYRPAETARLDMAVLDERGNTICDADLNLEITAPDGGIAYLNSANGLIKANPQCGPNNVIDSADYTASYGLSGAGEYKVKLIANTKNGQKIIYDQFFAAEHLPLTIERLGPTRIYPRAEYAVKMKVRANEGFKGDLNEIVPDGFKITNYELRINNEKIQDTNSKIQANSNFQFPNPNEIQNLDEISNSKQIENIKYKIVNNNGGQKLIWSDVELKAGDELTIEYTFKAPEISPEFYLLGPASIGDFTETRQWQIAADMMETRAKTVQFLAGTYSGNGVTGQMSDTNQTFSAFNIKLAEQGVSVKNAYVVFEAQFAAYNVSATAYSGYTLAFDACDGACVPNAFTGNSAASTTDATTLAYGDGTAPVGSNHGRMILDVTSEGQLAAYAGNNAGLTAQVGYNIRRGTTINSIAEARAVLVITYTYDSASPSYTNTVIYPLDSQDSGGGTKATSTATNCVFGFTCPKFNYNMDIPDFTAASSTNLSQWFQMQNQSDLNVANDVRAQMKIGTNATSSDFILEAFNSDQGNFPTHYFGNLAGYAENTAQTIEYRSSSVAGNYYLLGGEAVETYSASSSQAVKTRTVSFPIGVITNGSTATNIGLANVYFPENGSSSGSVTIKKAWIRILSNNYNTAVNTFNVQTKIGDNASSSVKSYSYDPAANVAKPSFIIIHTLPATDYTELALANKSTAKNVSISVVNTLAGQGGVSAELMITYAYTSEGYGYLTSLNLFGGQMAIAPEPIATNRSITLSTANSVLPETLGVKTIRAGALLASFMSSDSDGTVNAAAYRVNANLSTGAPACAVAYNTRFDGINGFSEFYKDVSLALNTTDNQAYNACYINNGAGDADTGGAKMNGILTYTYQWDNTAPTSTIKSISQSTDSTGRVNLQFEAGDADRQGLRAKIEYEAGATCAFSSVLKATLTADDASTTATTGDPKVDNNSSYQIGTSGGWITTTVGSNIVNTVWESKIDLPNADGTYCVRLTVNDFYLDQVTTATATVLIDNKAPTVPGPLTLNTKHAASLVLNLNATTTENHFLEYKIFYKIADGIDPTENDSVISSSTDENLGDIFFKNYSTTTISLSPNTTYSFAIWAYDTNSQRASSSRVDIKTNNYPTGVFNISGTTQQKNNGSGAVDVYFQADDPDKDTTLRAKIEYATGTICVFASAGDPTIDINDANTTADYSDPKVDNANEYQIGTIDNWITTTPTANNVTFDWLAKTDLPTADGDYCLRLTLSDGMDNQATSATTTLIIDNVNPSAPGALSKEETSMTSITLRYGATTTESHFLYYKIYYKEGTSGVTESDTPKVDDNLNYILFHDAATTTVEGLTANTNYVFNIWAYDQYGNKASATEVTYKTDATIRNQSLTFINSPSGNIGAADDLNALVFRAVVSEANGWAAIASTTLRLADQSDNSSPFNDLAFEWDQSSDTFTDKSVDSLNAARLSASSSSSCAGTSCTLDFRVIFNYRFRASSTDYAAELDSVNDAGSSDFDTYDDFYKIRLIKIRQIHFRWRNDDGGQ